MKALTLTLGDLHLELEVPWDEDARLVGGEGATSLPLLEDGTLFAETLTLEVP